MDSEYMKIVNTIKEMGVRTQYVLPGLGTIRI